MSFLKSFAKTAAARLPKSFKKPRKVPYLRGAGYSKNGITHMLRRRGVISGK